MNSFFDFSSGSVSRPLLWVALVAVGVLGVLAIRGVHLARIGVRNAGRRRARAALIVAGLMLSTMFIAASLAVDDTISLAVKTVAVYNLGRVDEDVTGGNGSLGLFPAWIGDSIVTNLSGQEHVAGVAPALVVPNVLVADETARQVRGGVSGVGMLASGEGPLGDLRRPTNAPAPVSALAADEVYLNSSTAQLVNASAGDTIYLYSTRWPGKRYTYRVRAIVTGGPLGDVPSLVLPLDQLQSIVNARGSINHVYVANQGNGLTGVGYSDAITHHIYSTLPDGAGVHVDKVKQDGVRFAIQAQDIFARILGLFTLFALAIGLLLIFLIFVLLAAERRAELGMVRALGMRREHVVRMLLFEGAVYDTAAAAMGILAGLGLGVAIVKIVSPIVERIGFPLQISIQPSSMIVAFCLGLVVTLITIWVAAWTVSRMTVAAALRDMPEPPAPMPSLLTLARDALLASLRSFVAPDRAAAAWLALAWALVARGLVPLALGLRIAQAATESGDTLSFSVGLSLVVAGGALVVRWLILGCLSLALRLLHHHDPIRILARATLALDRLAALVVGGILALYWSLPFDALDQYGFFRFGGGVQTFFIAGVMMVFGAVWALAPNLDLILVPAGWLLVRLGRLRHVARVATVYPSLHRFRTGVGLSLFALVCFTMVVMACIAASVTQSYDNVPLQAAGYDVAGQPLFAPVGGTAKVSHDLAAANSGRMDGISAVSSATPLPLGILQPGAPSARWSVYPTSEIQGAFLDGVGLPLVARASGYSSDTSVWDAVRNHPGTVVIDEGALSAEDAAALGLKRPPQIQPQQFIGPPIASGLPGLSSLESLDGGSPDSTGRQGLLPQFELAVRNEDVFDEITLRLDHVAIGTDTIAPTPIWVSDLRGGAAKKLTVIGVVDNTTGQRTGLFGSPDTFAPVETGLQPFGNEYYYFKVQPGVDAHAEALKIGSSLLNYGFETTVIQDVLLGVNGPRVFISRVIVGLVGLTLLVGMAALAVTGSRAVVERRQQIGMLRALGFRRLHVQIIFLFESLLVGATGTAIGAVLGLILCRNVFAVNFFEPVDPGLTLVIPWQELVVICAASLAASAIASLLPAIQAGRVAPADALRYE